jgi:hypothetical protein
MGRDSSLRGVSVSTIRARAAARSRSNLQHDFSAIVGRAGEHFVRGPGLIESRGSRVSTSARYNFAGWNELADDGGSHQNLLFLF